jgi:hypothetical protein
MARDRSDQAGGRLALFRGLLLLISLGLSLGFAELVVRIVSPQPPSWLAIYRRHPVLPFYSMLPDARLHVDTGETRWDIATDEHGFRFDPNAPRTSGECSTLWLGDSYAFGHGLEYGESFVGVVDRELDDVRVLNASVSGYGPTQYRRTLEYLIEQGLEFETLVVASYVGNDFHDTKWTKTQVVEDGVIGNEKDLKSFLMRNFHLYRLGASVYHRFAPVSEISHRKVIEEMARPDSWTRPFLTDARALYESEMTSIQRIANENDVEVAFVILPTRHAVSSMNPADAETTGEAATQPMLPVEKAIEIFDALGAPYLDATPVIAVYPAREMFFQYDGHLTEHGSAVVAEAILERLSLGCDENLVRAD